MKIWKLALAVLLAGGTVTAYLYFPNPIEQVSRREAVAPAGASSTADTAPDAQPSAEPGSN